MNKMEEYVVYFGVKEHNTEYASRAVVEATSAKEAKEICKKWFKEKTGKNAFRPTTRCLQEPMRHYHKNGTYSVV